MQTKHKNGWFSLKCGNEIHWYDEEGLLRKEESDNYIAYYDEDGEFHREDGPARIFTGGNMNEYWVHGEHIKCENQKEFEQLMRMKAFW